MYLDLLILLNFTVDFLLLVGTNRLAGYPPDAKRTALAAALGGLYGGACMLPGFRFLGNGFWRFVSLGLMACIAFGLQKSALRRGVLFTLLSMALGGVALGLGSSGFWAVVASAGLVCGLCAVGFRGKAGASFVPVELCYGGKLLRLTALRDTGNTLRDPVTGQQVLVVDAAAAQQLTGLTRQQLSKPVESIGSLPGLRLIPYRAVGSPGGMLLALRIPEVKIGSWRGSSLVAFAPEAIGSEYQALTGGAV